MSFSIQRARMTAAGLVVLMILAGCQTAGEQDPPELPDLPEAAAPVLPEPTPGLTPRERLRLALAQLQEGNADVARAELSAYLEERPNSGLAKRLLHQIDAPISDYFPEDHFEVTLADGESLSSVAQAYLGDSLSFFALARYNDISVPSQVRAGQVIRVPATESALAARDAKEAAPEPDEEVPAEVVVEAEQPDPPSAADEKLALSQAAEADGDVIQAYALAVEATELEPDNADATDRVAGLQDAAVDAHYRAAVSAFSQQDLEATLSHTDAVLAIDPDHANAKLYQVQAQDLKARLEALNRDD